MFIDVAPSSPFQSSPTRNSPTSQELPKRLLHIAIILWTLKHSQYLGPNAFWEAYQVMHEQDDILQNRLLN
jgi:hypothetical protein